MNFVRTNKILILAGMGIGNVVNFADLIEKYPDADIWVHDHPYLFHFICDYFGRTPTRGIISDYDLVIVPPICQRKAEMRAIRKIPYRVGLVNKERQKYKRWFTDVVMTDHETNERKSCDDLINYLNGNFYAYHN